MITKQKIDELHELLWHSGYRQLRVLTDFCNNTHSGIEVHCNAITIDVHVDAIKELLGGMGYTIESNTNTETITIK